MAGPRAYHEGCIGGALEVEDIHRAPIGAMVDQARRYYDQQLHDPRTWGDQPRAHQRTSSQLPSSASTYYSNLRHRSARKL